MPGTHRAARTRSAMRRSAHLAPCGGAVFTATEPAKGAALFLSINIAPTEETVFLAVGAKWWLLVLIVFATMLLSYAVVFYADIRGGRSPGRNRVEWAVLVVSCLALAAVLGRLLYEGLTDTGLAFGFSEEPDSEVTVRMTGFLPQAHVGTAPRAVNNAGPPG